MRDRPAIRHPVPVVVIGAVKAQGVGAEVSFQVHRGRAEAIAVVVRVKLDGLVAVGREQAYARDEHGEDERQGA